MNIILAFSLSAGLAGMALPARAADVDALGRSYNAFGFQLLAQCRQSLPNTNYFLSPAGLAFALSMVENGAQGETSRQIMATLQVGGMTLARLNEANKALLDHLAHLDPKIQLEIANAIWIDRKATIKPGFLAVNRSQYDAEVAGGDFQDPATVRKINDWVSARTRQKITSIVEPPLDKLLRMLLFDAIYFKGDWLSQFSANFTSDRPFTLADGQVVQRPRMMQTGRFAYFEGPRFQAVELPYAGNDISMFVFLPKAGLDEFLKTFTSSDFQSVMDGIGPPLRVTVELPRFKLENEYDLTRVLPAMGMPQAFEPSAADFGALSDEPLHIGFVKQKTYLDVNEQGTVAAAVTSIGMMGRAAAQRPFQFVVDRPFFLATRERQTGLILFLGAVFDPR